MNDGAQDFVSLILSSPKQPALEDRREPVGGTDPGSVSLFVQLLNTHVQVQNGMARALTGPVGQAGTDGRAGGQRFDEDGAFPPFSLIVQGLRADSPMSALVAGAQPVVATQTATAAAEVIDSRPPPMTFLNTRAIGARHGTGTADSRNDRHAGYGARISETLFAHSDSGGEVSGRDPREAPANQVQRPVSTLLASSNDFEALRLPAGLHTRLAVDRSAVDNDAQRLLLETRSASAAGSGEARSYNEVSSPALLGDDGFSPVPGSRPSPLAASELPAMQHRAAMQTLDRILIMSRKGIDHARLQLNPPDLGRVDIRLDLDGNDTRLQLTVQNTIARESVEAMLPKLREALQQQGLDLLDASVSEQHEDQAHGGLADQDSGPGTLPVHSSEGIDEGDVGNRPTRAVIEGAVDAYA